MKLDNLLRVLTIFAAVNSIQSVWLRYRGNVSEIEERFTLGYFPGADTLTLPQCLDLSKECCKDITDYWGITFYRNQCNVLCNGDLSAICPLSPQQETGDFLTSYKFEMNMESCNEASTESGIENNFESTTNSTHHLAEETTTATTTFVTEGTPCLDSMEKTNQTNYVQLTTNESFPSDIVLYTPTVFFKRKGTSEDECLDFVAQTLPTKPRLSKVAFFNGYYLECAGFYLVLNSDYVPDLFNKTIEYLQTFSKTLYVAYGIGEDEPSCLAFHSAFNVTK